MKVARLAEIRAAAEKHNGKGSKCVEMLLECAAEIEKLQRRKEPSVGPSLSEVMTYAEEIGLNSGEPEAFFDHHQARGWKLGPQGTVPMRDFKAALRTWKRNDMQRKSPANGKNGFRTNYGIG